MAGIADWWKPIGVGDDGVAHSTTNAFGYRDTQDDAINEKNVSADSAEQASSISPQTYAVAGLMGLAKGIQAASATATQRRVLENQAVAYDYQAKSSWLNAEVAKQNMYNAYQMGQWQAMAQGLEDAQKISATRSASAGSGVRMNTGSKAEVEKSARLIKEQNRITQQQNTTSSAMRQYINEANHKASAIVAEGNAQAARTVQHGYSPLLSGLTTMAGSFASYLLMAGETK